MFTNPFHQSKINRSLIRRILLFSPTAVLATAFGTLLPATAAPITYDLVAMTATFGPGTFVTGGTDIVTGSFTFDPSTDALSAASITVTGINPPPDGLYNIPNSGEEGPPVTAIEVAQAAGNILELIFVNPLGSGPDPLDHITIVAANSDFSATSESATGDAVPAPEPSTLPLLGSSLAVLGFGHWRSRRRLQLG